MNPPPLPLVRKLRERVPLPLFWDRKPTEGGGRSEGRERIRREEKHRFYRNTIGKGRKKRGRAGERHPGPPSCQLPRTTPKKYRERERMLRVSPRVFFGGGRRNGRLREGRNKCGWRLKKDDVWAKSKKSQGRVVFHLLRRKRLPHWTCLLAKVGAQDYIYRNEKATRPHSKPKQMIHKQSQALSLTYFL